MSQQIELIRWFMIREVREIYHSRTMILSYLLTSIVTLGIYWFTSKAFAPSIASGISGKEGGYFSYILIGDLTFMIPSLMFVGVTDSIRRCAVDRSLESMLTSKMEPRKLLLTQMFALMPIEVIKASLTLLLAIAFFNFQLPAISLFKILVLQILSLPLFIGLGLIAGAVLFRFSRGEGVVGQISSFATIFAGAYFPLAVFPESVSWLSKMLSPFSILLEGTRGVINGDGAGAFISLTFILLTWGIIVFGLGFYLIGKSLEFNRRKGAPYLFFR